MWAGWTAAPQQTLGAGHRPARVRPLLFLLVLTPPQLSFPGCFIQTVSFPERLWRSRRDGSRLFLAAVPTSDFLFQRPRKAKSNPISFGLRALSWGGKRRGSYISTYSFLWTIDCPTPRKMSPAETGQRSPLPHTLCPRLKQGSNGIERLPPCSQGETQN